TTPYGTTTFDLGEVTSTSTNDPYRWVQATDPMGGIERAEYHGQGRPGINDNEDPKTVPGAPLSVANEYLEYRNTFYWSKKAMANGKRDQDAKIFHWLHNTNANGDGIGGEVSPLLESEKEPLENRIWYQYPGQTNAHSDLGVTSGKAQYVAR